MLTEDRDIQDSVVILQGAEAWHQVEPSIWAPDEEEFSEDLEVEVLRTLLDQPRWIAPRFLYDEEGSDLFERISTLPEYYLTRTENQILSEAASTIISMAAVQCIVELGAGFSKKTVHLLKEQIRQRKSGIFAPIDVSLTALTASRDLLREELPELVYQGLCARYERGISSIDRGMSSLFAFLGSSIGNFNQFEFRRFFQFVTARMGPGDFLLLGVDRVKDVKILQRAYNDSEGLTARFILNVFRHINRFAGSNFDLQKIDYCATFNARMQRMEMQAISRCDQQIEFKNKEASFVWRKEEPILVEISRKFDPEQLQKQLCFFELEPMAHFSDPKSWFSLLLFKKSSKTHDEHR